MYLPSFIFCFAFIHCTWLKPVSIPVLFTVSYCASGFYGFKVKPEPACLGLFSSTATRRLSHCGRFSLTAQSIASFQAVLLIMQASGLWHCICLSKVLVDDRRCYLCNIFSDWWRLFKTKANGKWCYIWNIISRWLRPCYDIDGNWACWPISITLYINGLVQDCSNSIANALELLQSHTKALI